MLSGDNGDSQKESEQNLRNLIAPNGEGEKLVLTRSVRSDTFSGDLLADNLSGWLTSAISDPTSEYAGYAKDLIPTGVWSGWHQLVQSDFKLDSIMGASRLTSHI